MINRDCACGTNFECSGDYCEIKHRIAECLCPDCLLRYAQNQPHTFEAIPKALNHCFSGVESDSITALSDYHGSASSMRDEADG